MSENTEIKHYFASCPKGIEPLLLDELQALGGTALRQTSAGVAFSADMRSAYKALLWSRLANRIFMPLAQEKAHDDKAIYSLIYQIPWEQHFDVDATFIVDFIGTNTDIVNSQFGAQRVKDAVVDRFVKLGFERPSVNKSAPDVRINVRLTKAATIVSLDLSGESLHRRGYRSRQGMAPLKENLAAAILMRAGWPQRVKEAAEKGERTALVDPMCGSGTFLIEGVMMAANLAPGLQRKGFGFEKLLSYDDALWQSVVQEAIEAAKPLDSDNFPLFFGSDIDSNTLGFAQRNSQEAEFEDVIRLQVGALADFTLPEDMSDIAGLMICNPPYGERLGEVEALREDYRQMGQVAKAQLSKMASANWALGVFTSNVDLAKEMRLRAKHKYKFFNGALAAELHLFDILGGEATLRKDRDILRDPLSEGATMVANRLKKNQRRLDPWLKKNNITCYRLYDADMPEYAAAIDVYGDQYHLQEYQAPKSIDAKKAHIRFNDIQHALVHAFDLKLSQLSTKTRMRQKGSSQYEKLSDTRDKNYQTVQEGTAKLAVNLRDYLDTGLFLDHRPLRRIIHQSAKGKRFLNLFCYTASATVHSILGGAEQSVSVDLSNTYLDWAKRNFSLNNIRSDKHQLVRADCVNWLKNCRQGFDIIMLDPPSFSNSKNTDTVLDVQRDHLSMIRRCMEILNPQGVLYFSTNLRSFKLDESITKNYAVEDKHKESLDPDFERNPKIHACWAIRNKE